MGGFKFGQGINLDKFSDEFKGQGHRSKLKVARLKKVIFGFSDGLTCAGSLCHDVMQCHDVTS